MIISMYFVGWFKHGRVQHIVSGPFPTLGDAKDAVKGEDIGHVIVKADFEAAEFEVVDE